MHKNIVKLQQQQQPKNPLTNTFKHRIQECGIDAAAKRRSRK